MDNEAVISAKNVAKVFKLPHEKASSIKSLFINFYRRNRSYEMQQALKDVSFDIKKGEFFGIVGRNGSGKSTLLKLLAGIYQPTSGNVSTVGKIVPFIELGVGFNPELTGRDNVYLNGALLGFSRKQMEAMYDDIVSFAELEKFMDQKLKNYSSGMEVRLAFSLAIRAKADILLIDEVLAVGDADFQRKCFDYFKTLKKNKMTVVFVSHDMNAVREFCERGILVENGVIKYAGKAQDIAREYSRLFMNEEKPAAGEPAKASKRWGNGDVRVSSVKAVLEKDDVVVKVKTKVVKPIDKVIYGLHVIGPDGQEVTAMNNRMINTPDINRPKVGENIEIDWRVLNVFNDGTYSITVTLIDDVANTLDWITEAATFIVKREERSTTAVLPPVSVTTKIGSN